MNEFKYRFTIFTPCYNSEIFLERVYKSVSNQTFRDFEWLLINDASTDGTSKLLGTYQAISDFPIRVITNKENKMLYYNFNLAFEEAHGEFMIFAGHDDEFDVNTLDRFKEVWDEYGNEDIAGIWCRSRDQYGNTIGSAYPKNLIISDYHSMFEKYIYGSQERFGVTRTDILKKHKFNLKQQRIGEGFLWSDIGMEFNTIYINDILRTYYIERHNLNALTKRSRTEIAKENYLYYVEFLNRYIIKVPKALLLKLRFHFATSYYGCLLNKTLNEMWNDINNPISKILLFFAFPFAYLLSRIKS